MNSIKIFKYIIAINIAIVLLFILFLFGVKFFNSANNKSALQIENNTPKANENIIETNEDNTNEVLSKELIEQNIYNDIIKTGDFDKCNTLTNQESKSICINNIALNKANESLDIMYCDYLDGKITSIDNCKMDIVSQLVNNSNNVDPCQLLKESNKITECSDSFSKKKAISNNDYTYCEKFSELEKKNSCYFSILYKKLSIKKKIDCETLPNIKGIEDDCLEYNIILNNPVDKDCNDYTTDLFKVSCSQF